MMHGQKNIKLTDVSGQPVVTICEVSAVEEDP